MVRCIQRNIKSSFSHHTLITSIHLNIKTIMWNQVSCPSTESSCTHHAIISQFRYIFKVGQVLSKTQRVYNLQCFFNLPFKLKNIWVKRSEIIFDGTYVIDRNFQMYWINGIPLIYITMLGILTLNSTSKYHRYRMSTPMSP